MRVPVKQKNARGPRRLAAGLLLLGFGLGVWLTIEAHPWLNSYLDTQITDMGGAPANRPLYEKATHVVKDAWPKQRAAANSAPAIPTLTLDVKRPGVAKLARKRNEALARGYLIQETGDFVNAKIRVENGEQRKVVKAKIRLKGDFTDHIKGDKWSFRVRVSGTGEILGMRVFSIQHPKVRGYAHESLILEHMRSEGVLAPRYELVRVVVNGRDKGIMALEEHFSKELLESQQRRESVIVRFDEALKWRTVVLMGQQVDFSAPYPLITPFQGGRVASRPDLARDLNIATALMRGFLEKRLAPSQVFDPDVTARFLAVAEIWGAEHSLAWNNMRFYFNPITGLLEPIAFDANLQDAAFMYFPTALVSVYRLADNMTADWLEDPEIRKPFLQTLERLSKEYAQEAGFEQWSDREAELHRVLHQEFPLIPDIRFDFYRLRSMRLARVDESNFRHLPLLPPNYPVLMHAFLQSDGESHQLELFNLVPYPVKVTAVTLAPASTKTSAKLPITLPPTIGLDPPKPARIRLTTTGDIGAITAKVSSVIQGYPNSKSTITAHPYHAPAERPVLPAGTWDTVLKDHDCVNRKGNTAVIGPGSVHIRRKLILPRGASLEIVAGTQIRFDTDALILAQGAVQMRGTAAAPIDLIPSDKSWRGIAVMNTDEKSVWTHVRVRGTRGLELGKWTPTGSVMFYQSDVEMQNCSFTDNSAEDMLNLFRCNFALSEITVERCASDAIDMDFCQGRMTGGTLREIGGDGVDVSGTVIELSGTRFEKITDKALSAGERSHMTITQAEVTGAGTGLASKDDSRVHLSKSTFREIRFVAVMAFTKKAEYGPATIEALKITVEGDTPKFKAQTGSSITVDGSTIPVTDFDVDALYRTGPMRKKGGS